MRSLSFLVLLAACGSAAAEVWMPTIFGDNMVLQQGREIPVWGKAAPGEKVTVSLAGKNVEVTAGEDGRWKARLEPLQAGGGPLEMKVSGSNTLVFRNVLAGDVWICSGQSNMAWPLAKSSGGPEAAQQADFPDIRFFEVARRAAFDPADDLPGKWVVCSPATANSFSGVGFFFGREIHAARKVPVGLISSSWGGTPAQGWTSIEKLESHPKLKQYATEFLKTKGRLAELNARYEAEVLPRWKEALAKWKASPEPRGRKPRQPLPPDKSGKLPVALFNGMIHPLIPYGIKGVIWYQGEANSGRPAEYAELFPLMIKDWRERWGQGDFPFLFVQLAGYHNPMWVAQREAQRKALDLPATGMAVALDVGEQRDIHPKDKQSVGKRLAQTALSVAYGEAVEPSGPVFTSLKANGPSLVVSFAHVGGGLTAGTPVGQPAAELLGFEVAGANGEFFPAQAKIEGKTVIVSSDKVANPSDVRYGWAPWPEPMVNLYSKEGMPAVPFSSRPEALAGPVAKDAAADSDPTAEPQDE